MREISTGARGFKSLPVFVSSAFITSICLLFTISRASAQGSAATSGSSQTTAAAAQSQAGQGQGVQLQGELEILQQDFKDGRDGLLYSLKLSDGTRVPLHFANQPPKHLLTGAHVRANGQLSGGTLILYSGSNVTTTTTTTTASTSSIPLSNTFGAQSTLVILVNFQDAPSNQPWTPAQVQSEVFGSSGTSGYLQEASYGQTSLTGDVDGWYTIAVSSTTCDTNQIATDANNAASAAGVNLAAYTRLVYIFPYTSACGWAGAATIGGSPSQSWINGGGTTTNTFNLGIFAHEMGHNLGLYHSHGLDCGTATLSGQCTVWEYFDSLDVMGSGQGHYNSFQKERLGWLNYGSSPPIIGVTTPGTYTYTMVPYEAADSNTKALKVLKFTNPITGLSYYYYIEYRQPLGFDSFISSMGGQNITSGVVIHLVQDGAPNSSDLLDMNPSSSGFDWSIAALTAGASYSDPDAGVAITTQSVGSVATVNVSITQPSCVRALPAISISPSQASPVIAGSTVNYTVTVADNDSSSCGASTFSLQPAIAYGWTDNLSNSQLTLSPGTNSSATLSVTSGSNSNNGSNPVGVTATNIADFVYSGSGWATYSVGVPSAVTVPTVTVSTGQAVYSPGQTVAINATVALQGSPVAKASVTFNVTDSNGAIIGSGSGTTGSNGTTSFKAKLGRHVAKGIYAAKGQTSVDGVSADGVANFQVQ
jgi:Gametolysin peptidase M11